MTKKEVFKTILYITFYCLFQLIIIYWFSSATFLIYLNILTASFVFYIIIREKQMGLFLSGSVLLFILVFQKKMSDFSTFIISIGYLFFMSCIGLFEKHKQETMIYNFKANFFEIKNKVRACEIEKKKLEELELKINDNLKDVDSLYDFSKSLGNFITKDELFNAIEEGFRKMNLRTDFIFFVNYEVQCEMIYTNIRNNSKIFNLLKDNMWLEKTEFIEINNSFSTWKKYWLRIFPYAKSVIIYPMRVIEDRLGFIIYVLKDNSVNIPRLISISNVITICVKKVILYEKIKELSRRDGLTKLYSRRYFFEKFENELKRANRYNTNPSVIMTDLDHFKEINDTYGHQAGDYVLKTVSKIIMENISDIDFAGRYGGDEICTVLVNYTKKDAIKLAEEIKDKIIKSNLKHQQQEISLTISMGISFYPEDGQDFKELILHADNALYIAKKLGRNKIYIYGERQIPLPF